MDTLNIDSDTLNVVSEIPNVAGTQVSWFVTLL